MLNVKYWRIFCDVISLLAPVFIVPFDRACKEVVIKSVAIIKASGSDMGIGPGSKTSSYYKKQQINILKSISHVAL